MNASDASPLSSMRRALARRWLVVSSGVVYFISQLVIAFQIEHLGSTRLLALQVTGFSAARYQRAFHQWQAEGVMPFYHSHLIFDDVHPLWYAVLVASGMALAMNAAEIRPRRNALLLMPVVGALCDLLENALQHVFLSDPAFTTIVDPLPLVSTLASITKWLLLAVSLALIFAWVLMARRKLAA